MVFIIITYVFYGSCFSVWEKFFCFNRPSVISDGPLYYPYLELLELMILIYIRTRISLYYFPKIISIINVIYLYYWFTNFFPFAGLATALLCSLTLVIFLIFIKIFELPTRDWNPFSLHTPSLNNTRQAYIETLRSNFSLGFDIWSLFYAPSFRTEFNSEEQFEISTDVEPIQFDFSEMMDNLNGIPPENQ